MDKANFSYFYDLNDGLLHAGRSSVASFVFVGIGRRVEALSEVGKLSYLHAATFGLIAHCVAITVLPYFSKYIPSYYGSVALSHGFGALVAFGLTHGAAYIGIVATPITVPAGIILTVISIVITLWFPPEGFYGDLNGKGGRQFANGDTYEGAMNDGVLDGEGTYVKPGVSTYKGTFQNGKREGQGTLTLENGQKYEGTFKNNQFHGHGKYFWENGETFEGEFLENKRVGKGTLTMKEKDLVKYSYVGQWVDDMLDGEVLIKFSDGKEEKHRFEKNVDKGIAK